MAPLAICRNDASSLRYIYIQISGIDVRLKMQSLENYPPQNQLLSRGPPSTLFDAHYDLPTFSDPALERPAAPPPDLLRRELRLLLPLWW